MEFCSEYGYDYGCEGSENEDREIDDKSRKIKTKIRKADTNIIAVKFDQLVSANEMFAGEPKKCACGAFMSHVSAQNVQKTDGKFMWKCEFCEQTNDMSGVLEDVNEIPKDGDVTFLLEAAKPKAQSASASGSNEAKSTDNSYLAFCMDISGSMNSYIPVKNSGKSMSRLEAVKIACFETLNKLKVDEPEKQVALVTFSSYVKYYGDCTQVRQPILEIRDNNELNNKEIIQSKAYNTDGNIKGIAQSNPNIEQRLKLLKTEGSTALGPALLYSIVFASKKPGSSIILCTDGCANVGLGSIESGNNIAQGEKYYDEIADFAKEQGVVVNVLSMEGTDCKLTLLGRVADRSNGTLSIVNPLNLSEEFKSILENRLVATNVQAKLIVNHKYLYIRNEENEREESKALEKNDDKAKAEAETKRKSIVSREIGNVNIDTEITFEYGIRKLDKGKKKSDALKEMPFQLQITYTASDGSKAVRVYTKMQKFTQNRREAESNIHSRDLLFMHKAQATAGHLLHDDIIVSKMKNMAYLSMYERNDWKRTAYEDNNFSKINSKTSDMRFLDCNDVETSEMYGESKISRNKLSKIKTVEEEKKKRFTLPAMFSKKEDDDSDDEAKNKKKEEKIKRRDSKRKSKKESLNVSQLKEEDEENNEELNTRKSCQIM